MTYILRILYFLRIKCLLLGKTVCFHIKVTFKIEKVRGLLLFLFLFNDPIELFLYFYLQALGVFIF